MDVEDLSDKLRTAKLKIHLSMIFDGLVIKLNNLNYWKAMNGYQNSQNTQLPSNMIESVNSKIINILSWVGRAGKITYM